MSLSVLRSSITSSAAITLTADELDATDLVRIVTTSPQLTMTTFGQLALFIQGEVVGLYNDGGVLGLSNPFGWPTAPLGLPGSLWSNGGAVSAVLGSTPNPSASPVFFGAITSSALLALTGVNLPLSDPGVDDQLWNNAGLVCISLSNSNAGLYDAGGVLAISDTTGWPTDSSGTPGSVWSNGGVASVVPGYTPVFGSPVFFGHVLSTQLLALGATTLPVTAPISGSGQLWVLNGEILIA